MDVFRTLKVIFNKDRTNDKFWYNVDRTYFQFIQKGCEFMPSFKRFTPEIRTLNRGESMVYPYALSEERLLLILSGEAALTLQMHFKPNSLGMLEAISSKLELNDEGQLVHVLDEAPEQERLSAPSYFIVPKGGSLELSTQTELEYTFIEAATDSLAGFMAAAKNVPVYEVQRTMAVTSSTSLINETATEPIKQASDPSTEADAYKPPIPKSLRLEPKQRFFYYTVENRLIFALQLLGLVLAGIVLFSILPNLLGFVLFVAAFCLSLYLAYFEIRDIGNQKPVLSIIDDGLIVHNRHYKDMPLLWSEISAMNLVVREGINGAQLALELVLLRPETKINYLNPALKAFFDFLIKRGNLIVPPKLVFKNTDFDLQVEALKDLLLLAKGQNS